ncbi:hypothetical protein [Iningainema tapete]|uniref:Uncharacterized protein n=1 Tax=Iningainema tapete BLCC-T55 TaxID=2748662 RepID=A0A8J7C6Y7_9CYAN|nr:hypothetical protein [Iningainema tapete]MBD2774959.1 hypothetical protein [Iningainema tapete BLCC-T55]
MVDEITPSLITPKDIIQKYLEVLAVLQKALDIEPASQPNEEIELESKQEMIVGETGNSSLGKIYTAEELAEEKRYLAVVKAKILAFKAENHKKFLTAQSKFADSQVMFGVSQMRFRSRKLNLN